MADKTASGSGGSSAQDSSKKVGLIGLVGIVISAMIGGGIYNLPQNMAQTPPGQEPSSSLKCHRHRYLVHREHVPHPVGRAT